MNRDSRINARVITWRSYLVAFLLMTFLATATLTVYIAQSKQPVPDLPAKLALAGFVMAASGVGCLVFSLYRRRVMKPVQELSAAAQRVAAGDFSVRLSPRRRDGKKDEFEVLFEDFNTMAAELASTETLKTDFISNVSHEMKTPLAVIRNYAQLLKAPGLTDHERQEYAAAIDRSAERMTGLITDILRLNRLENQQILPEVTEFDLCRQLTDCILLFEDKLEEKDLALEADLEDAAPIRSDESLLELVWNNLLSNAVKFTPEGGTVTVTQRTEGNVITVTVADTGPGIGPEEARRIFDKFYQGDASRSVEGNGLGLALVKRVMDMVGGSVTVESGSGTGCRFTVTLRRDGHG